MFLKKDITGGVVKKKAGNRVCFSAAKGESRTTAMYAKIVSVNVSVGGAWEL